MGGVRQRAGEPATGRNGEDPRPVGRKTRRARSEAALSRICAGFEPRRRWVRSLHVTQREAVAENSGSSVTQKLTLRLKTGADSQVSKPSRGRAEFFALPSPGHRPFAVSPAVSPCRPYARKTAPPAIICHFRRMPDSSGPE
jgi:hypothetical protein